MNASRRFLHEMLQAQDLGFLTVAQPCSVVTDFTPYQAKPGDDDDGGNWIPVN
jgi:hypothetical protein